MTTLTSPTAARTSRPASAHPASPHVTQAGRRALRLTRRGRSFLLLVVLSLLLAAFVCGRAVSQAAVSTASQPSPTPTMVEPGDTLWSLAQRIAPERDPREIVTQIRRLNHLSASQTLQAGQQLLLPVAV